MDGNQTEVSIKFKNSVTKLGALEKYAETLTKIRGVLAGIDTGVTKELDKSAKNTENVDKNIKNISEKINQAFDYAKLQKFSRALFNVVKGMSNLITKSSDYLENINLFQVAFENNYNSAEKFINKLNEMYGLDESWLTKTVGIFKQLSNAMNLSTEQGTKLSTLLTRMSVDISSLYNVDINRASSVLQSAMAGQTRPIRSTTGADITQATLQQTLNELDIDRPITQLSYAEKRLITIVSLTKQLTEATNDFGRTIESPANQMRILSEQWERLSRAVGNLFLPIVAKVLPYLNAILMVLTEIISAVANLFGFNTGDYDYFSGIADSVLDLEEGLDGASESAKKLKQGLRGFDKLNVITTPTNGSSGSGAGGIGSIDNSIWDAFNVAFEEYEKKIENIQMKATKIRDILMEWLGFTKQIDDVTGDVSFKFEKITGGTVLGALIVGGTIYNGIAGITKFLAKIGIISKGLPTIFGLISKAIVGIATALGISVGWVVAIAVALVALVALIIVFWDEIKAFVVDLWGTVSNFFVDLWNSINENFVQPIINFFTGVADFIWTNAIKPIIDFFAPIVEAIVSVFSLIVTKTAEIVVGIGKAIWSIITKIGEIFLKIVEILVALGKAFYTYVIKPVFEFIGNVATWVYENAIKPILNFFKKVGEWVYNTIIKPIWDKIVWLKDKAVSIFKTIGTIVVEFVSNAFKTVINGVLGAIERTINGFIKMLNKAIDIINLIPEVEIKKVTLLNIPRLKTGMDFVPHDFYPAYLDYGERVLTKEENRAYMNNQNEQKNYENKSTSFNPTFIIQVGDKEVARTVLKDLQDMAKSNGKPIMIS